MSFFTSRNIRILKISCSFCYSSSEPSKGFLFKRSPLKHISFSFDNKRIRFSLMANKRQQQSPFRFDDLQTELQWNLKIIKMPLRTPTTKKDVLWTSEGQFIIFNDLLHLHLIFSEDSEKRRQKEFVNASKMRFSLFAKTFLVVAHFFAPLFEPISTYNIPRFYLKKWKETFRIRFVLLKDFIIFQ